VGLLAGPGQLAEHLGPLDLGLLDQLPTALATEVDPLLVGGLGLGGDALGPCLGLGDLVGRRLGRLGQAGVGFGLGLVADPGGVVLGVRPGGLDLGPGGGQQRLDLGPGPGGVLGRLLRQ
jgi:hypothetical protein